MALPKSHIAILSLRGISLLFLLISLVILINNGTRYKKDGQKNFFVVGLGSYSYMFGAIIIGIGYIVLQTIVFVIFQIIMKSDKWIVFKFYGDKAISYLLLSAAAAGIGASRELKARPTCKAEAEYVDYCNTYNNYLTKGFAAASLLLPAFVCMAILSILSSYALSKKIRG